MKQLNYQLRKVLSKHPISQSKNTQKGAHKMAQKIATDLHSGHNQLSVKSIGEKHAHRLVDIWKTQNLTNGYMKNMMVVLRHILRFAGKVGAISKNNAKYNIGKRKYVTNKDKSEKLTLEKLDSINNPYVAMSVRLQDEFMLRPEESMKIQPGTAHIVNEISEHLVLEGSWCKGKRPRIIPVANDRQRELLAEAKELAKTTPFKSLIPAYPPDPDGKRRDYKNHLKVYKRDTKRAGCSHTHGFRHGAAHRHYERRTGELAMERYGQPGWKCKAAGGVASNELNPRQHEIDREVRREIMGILGHGFDRWDVVAIYLGT